MTSEISKSIDHEEETTIKSNVCEMLFDLVFAMHILLDITSQWVSSLGIM